MAYALLGFFKETEKFPDIPPEFVTHVGWMCLAVLALMMAYAWTRAESVRRGLLALEDPRTFAILRVGFAIMTVFCFLNLAPYWRMLWSDEGVFDLFYAQDRMGRAALRGWTPEEGFFDAWAYASFLWNKPSLHYIYGSPSFVVGYMVVFFVVLGMYAAGIFSRVTGVLSWLMMSGLYNRNSLYWEGTDTVYRCFWFILLFAKTGHAWSFDNWWRCRRLRKQGRLDEGAAEASELDDTPSDGDVQAESQPDADKPSPSSRQLEPIYRRVPAWPRYLFMMQVAAVYITTGSVKWGSVWVKGDALYYALNMDHFYRFEYLTQWVSSIFGMNLFRLSSWVTHWWERLFPFVLIGVALDFGLRHQNEPWYRKQNVWWRKWLARGLLVAVWVIVYQLAIGVTPFCLPMSSDGRIANPADHLMKIHLFFGGIVPAFFLAWFALGRWPLTLFRGGRTLGPLTKRWSWAKLPELRIDQALLAGLFVGRRLWLTLGFLFHGIIIGFMNIGMFAPIMLMTYASFFRGEEYVRLFRWLGRLPVLRRLATPSRARLLLPAQDPATVPVRGRRMPDLVVLAFGLMGGYLVLSKIDKAEWLATATYWWLGAIVVVAAGFRLWRPRPIDRARAKEPGPALAYGGLGRALAVGAVTWHVTAVAFHLWPSYAVFSKWRSAARAIHSSWLRGTGTSQSWRMFSPNPPRSNTFMKTVVVLENGERWDLRNNAYHYNLPSGPDSRPNPWIINDRMRKMQRRMVGKGKWYLRYWANYECREWQLKHDGEMPDKIDIKKYTNRIPKPEVVNFWQPKKFKGRKDPSTDAISGEPYNPRKLKTREVDVQSHDCKGKGDLPIYMKERYGFPITPEDEAAAERDLQSRKRKYKTRRDTWERRKDWGRWWAEDETKKGRRHVPASPTRSRQIGGDRQTAGARAAEPEDEQNVGDDDGVE